MRDTESDRTEDGLAEQAALWVARMQSADASPSDRQDFKDWLASDPSHKDAYEDMAALWGDMRDVRLTSPSDQGWKSSRAVLKTVCLLCLSGAAALLPRQTGLIDRLQSDHYTSVGETRVLMLEDGTQVSLNSDTAIETRYSDRERRIVLLRGEAFFDVAKNPHRPFTVDNNGLKAQALGTHYGVRTGNGSLPQEVQVEEGEVEVETTSGIERLGAGDVATLDSDGAIVRSRQDVANNTAWREGKLVFSGQSLRQVLQILAQYRHGRIVVLDDTAARLSVSGIFDLHDTDQALRILESNLPVTVTKLSDMMVLVRSR
ncbi:iron dicitrate transport regulator FecR [Agrobacterium rubi]|uniref:FecR family protein n=1 Tax=Agrobacterium rubi TaxID=28099 RepID=UPI00201B9099|nr:FecR family protein [Agrobacterium rubi]MCL6654607.1 iron dicitrate transport regulator FecR [Agrobacterium rubi]